MPTIKISAHAVAHLLQAQPNETFDCTALDIRVKAPAGSELKVDRLNLVLKKGMAATSTTDIPHIEVITYSLLTPRIYLGPTSYETSFHVVAEDGTTNPFLQAIPTYALLPANHPLSHKYQIPIDPPYTCTLEETHQLLRANIDDLPFETIKHWTVCPTVSTSFTWPTSKPTTFSVDEYHFSTHPAEFSFIVNGYNGPRPLYTLRNRIILAEIFSQIALLCSCTFTANRLQQLTEQELSCTPTGVDPSHILLALSSPPGNTPIDHAHTTLLPLQTFFALPYSYHPAFTEPLLSPAQILENIQQVHKQAQQQTVNLQPLLQGEQQATG